MSPWSLHFWKESVIARLIARLIARVALGVVLGMALHSTMEVEAQEVGFDLSERAVSGSGQFYVYGGDQEGRSIMASTGEELRRGVVRLLGMRGQSHSHPIVVTMRERGRLDDRRPEAELRLINTDGGLSIQLDFVFSRSQPRVDLAVELVRAILLEIAAAELRTLPENTPYALPPDWLCFGILEWVRVEVNGAAAPVFEGMLEARIPFHDLLSKRYHTLDGTTGRLFRSYAYALIRLLTAQSQGQAGLRQLVRNAPSYPLGGLEVLGDYFPALIESGDSLDKWWLVNVARLTQSGREASLLNVRQSEARLVEILAVPVVTREGEQKQLGLEQYREIARLPNRGALLEPVKGRLLQLALEASPLYAPVLQEYDVVVTNIMTGRTREVEEQLARLELLRELIVERDDQIEDYLNWYEATQPLERSDAFVGYMEAVQTGLPDSPLAREDAVSIYLDALERELR